jgi:peptidoglycan-associated lipoprotein
MKKLVFASVIMLVLSACAEQAIKDDGLLDGGAGSEQSGATVGSISGGTGSSGTMLEGQEYAVSYEKGAINDPGNILSQKVIYFDFDSSEIRTDYVELVKHHGKYLALNTAARIRLEGHTDERGSREYNVALADRRAQAVKRLLLFEGASSDQVTIISYGEEKPAEFGHDDHAWSLNRRAEIIYE